MRKTPPLSNPAQALAWFALALLAVGSYIPALSGGFVWDDQAFTQADPIRTLSGLWQIWLEPASLESEGHYWPLTYTTLWLEHKLWGFAPAGYHAVNMALHLANTLLVWRLLDRLAAPAETWPHGRADGRSVLALSAAAAWLAAALFAVHPVHVEVVAWVIARKDLLATLCYLGAFLAWLRFVQEPRAGRYVLALLLFVAGLLCKSIVVTLPAALLVWHWWHQGRLARRDIVRLLPWLAIGFSMVLADWFYYHGRETVFTDYTFVERMLIAAHALWFYAGKLLVPINLAVIYPHWDVRPSNPLAWGYVLAALALAGGLWQARRRIGRGPVAIALLFAVTLAPVLGLIDYGYMKMSFAADRYQYLASIWPLAAAASAITYGMAQLVSAMGRRCVQAAVLAMLMALSALTWRQAGIYQDELTFFRHIIVLNPQASDAYQNLGAALHRAGDYEGARAAFEAVLRQQPDSAQARNSLGTVMLRLDRLDEAERQLRRGLQTSPDHPLILQNLGEVHRKRQRPQEALAAYRAALRGKPDFGLAHAGVAFVLSDLGRPAEVAAPARRALELLPPETPVVEKLHLLLGRALEQTGQLEAAAGHYEQALQAEAHRPRALAQLAQLRMAQGRYRQAQTRLRALLEVDPANASAHTALGIALGRLGQIDEALAHLERALAIEPASTSAQDARAWLHGMKQRSP